ncbi:MAG: TRAP transporter substrate-binding protein, partial [Firmicutes bacterium]|nr:TRAP transporter substrate-binding protein [Bacillota bacterium]
AAWGETIDPWSHPQSAYFNVFKYYVETLSNGRMSVTLHPAASMGTAPQVLDLLVRGTVQVCGSMPSGVVASKYCPTLNALNIPYLFSDTKAGMDVLEAPHILGHVNEKLEKAAGIRILSVIGEGQRFMTNSVRPIRKPADLKGLKMRVMEGEIYSTVMKALGASPVPVPWAELYTCLQTKVVDGQENPPMNIVYKALQEVQKYMTIPGPFSAMSATYINTKFYKSLSPEDRWVVDMAAMYAAQAHRGVFEVKDMEAKKLLQEKLEVYVLSPKELQEFKDACQPAVIAMMDKLTEGDMDFVKALLEEVKASEARLGIK